MSVRARAKEESFRYHASALLNCIRDDCRRNEQPDVYETSYKPLLLEASHNYTRKKLQTQIIRPSPKQRATINPFTSCQFTHRSTITPKQHSSASFRKSYNINGIKKKTNKIQMDFSMSREQRPSISAMSMMVDSRTAFLMRLYIAKTKDLQIVPNHKQERIFLNRLQETIKDQDFVAPDCDFGYNSILHIIKFLSTNRVRRLVLDKNPIGDDSTIKLSQVLGSLALEELSLISINITPKSAVHLIRSLTGNSTLSILNLSSPQGLNRNRINAEGYAQISKVLTNPACCLHTLNLSNTGMGPTGFLNFLNSFQEQSHLKLRSLNLSCNQISIEENQQIFVTNTLKNIHVEKLELQGNSLADIGGKILGLIIGGKYGRSAISISLKYLDISDNKIKLSGFECLCSLLPLSKKLVQLQANNNDLAEKDIFYCVKNLLIHTETIRTLSLRHTLPASAQNVVHHIKSLADGLFHNKSLKQLDISYCNLSQTGFHRIFESLQTNITLKILRMQGCGIGDSFLAHTQPIIKECRALTEINLCNNYITDQGAKILIKILSEQHDIMEMNLKRNCISLYLLSDVSYQLKENKQMVRATDPQFLYIEHVEELQLEKRKKIEATIKELTTKKKNIQSRELALEIVKDQEQILKREQEIRVERNRIAKIETDIANFSKSKIKRRVRQYSKEENKTEDTFLVTS